MNMKEKVRAEITKTLKVLELGCFNMAALLRGLGIPVKGGISPPPQEVCLQSPLLLATLVNCFCIIIVPVG